MVFTSKYLMNFVYYNIYIYILCLLYIFNYYESKLYFISRHFAFQSNSLNSNTLNGNINKDSMKYVIFCFNLFKYILIQSKIDGIK